MSAESIRFRRPSVAERRLLGALAAKATGLQLPQGWLDQLRVRDMRDGGMGSLELFTKEPLAKERRLGIVAAELRFKDRDGVDVLASLNLDKDGDLFELDIWKVDFSPLIHVPDEIVE